MGAERQPIELDFQGKKTHFSLESGPVRLESNPLSKGLDVYQILPLWQISLTNSTVVDARKVVVGKFFLCTKSGFVSYVGGPEMPIGVLLQMNKFPKMESLWLKLLDGKEEEKMEVKKQVLLGIEYSGTELVNFAVGEIFYGKSYDFINVSGKLAFPNFSLLYLPLTVDLQTGPNFNATDAIRTAVDPIYRFAVDEKFQDSRESVAVGRLVAINI